MVSEAESKAQLLAELAALRQRVSELEALLAIRSAQATDNIRQLLQVNEALKAEIQNRRRAEETCKESESRLQAIFQAAKSVSLIVTDLDETNPLIKEFSPGAESIFGYQRQEVIGQPVAILHLPEDRAEFPKMQARLRRGESGFSGEMTLVRKSGQRFPALFALNPIKDAEGKVICALEVSVDLSLYKQAEITLAEERKRTETILASLNTGLSLISPDFRVVWVNDKMRQMFPEAEPFGLICYQYYERREAPCPDCPTRLAFQTGQLCQMEKFNPKRGRWFSIISQPIKDEAGQVSHVLEAVTDITERKRAEEEKARLEARLRQAQKMEAIGTLAGGIAHDFNNILAAMIGYAELGLLELPEDQPVRRHLDQVLKAGLRAKKLVQQILSFSRPSEPKLSPIRLESVVAEALSLLRASLPTTIEIVANLETDSAAVLADQTQIHQLLMNLCANAAYAMREKGGLLEISLKRIELAQTPEDQKVDLPPGAYQRLSVRDSGIGMDEKTLERIFEPFFTTKPPGEGSGMGLAVVHGIVRSHGGAISVFSQPGQGSTFHVYLPLVKSEGADQPASQPAGLPRGNERILFVDDETALAEIGRQMLTRLGYRVTSLTSSGQALELFRTEPEAFDLVITDQTMPHFSGLQLAQEMHKIRPGLPIIICTGYSDQVTPDRLRAAGLRRLLLKPLVTAEVAAAVRAVLDEQEGWRLIENPSPPVGGEGKGEGIEI